MEVLDKEGQYFVANVLVEAAHRKVMHELGSVGSPSFEDIERAIARAVQGILLQNVSMMHAQRYALRHRVGPAAALEDSQLPTACARSPETNEPMFLDELRSVLMSILCEDPAKLLESIRQCRAKIQISAEQEIADRTVKAAETCAGDEQVFPMMRILHLIEIRHGMQSFFPAGEPGMLVFPEHPFTMWVTPYDQLPKRLKRSGTRDEK